MSFNVKESGSTIVTNFVPKTRITRCYDQFNDAVAECYLKQVINSTKCALQKVLVLFSGIPQVWHQQVCEQASITDK